MKEDIVNPIDELTRALDRFVRAEHAHAAALASLARAEKLVEEGRLAVAATLTALDDERKKMKEQAKKIANL